MKLRAAKLTDAPGIAKVHVDSWRTTYKNIISNEFLQKLSYEQRANSWFQNLSNPNNYVFVVENNEGDIVGFADCGKRTSNQIDESGDITSIYILEEYQGQGIGKQLMHQLFIQCHKLGFNRVFVAVLEDNNTRYFYEYYGAKLRKTEKIKIGGTDLNLLGYEWDCITKALNMF
ncbi:GNAT family N-acetyltransferase [Gottfriedia sp. OAE603]|uniref:GNAT family N-acetyltransferase n=1 Tax=Gottfriedia sp. OAE603 TaxID=2663872 RepID=UPI00178BE22B